MTNIKNLIILLLFPPLSGCAFLFLSENYDSIATLTEINKNQYQIILTGDEPAHPTSEFDMFIPSRIDTKTFLTIPRKTGTLSFNVNLRLRHGLFFSRRNFDGLFF